MVFNYDDMQIKTRREMAEDMICKFLKVRGKQVKCTVYPDKNCPKKYMKGKVRPLCWKQPGEPKIVTELTDERITQVQYEALKKAVSELNLLFYREDWKK